MSSLDILIKCINLVPSKIKPIAKTNIAAKIDQGLKEYKLLKVFMSTVKYITEPDMMPMSIIRQKIRL